MVALRTTRFNKVLVHAVGRMPVVFFVDCNRPGAVYWAYTDQVDEVMATLNYGGSAPVPIPVSQAAERLSKKDPGMGGGTWNLVKIEPVDE